MMTVHDMIENIVYESIWITVALGLGVSIGAAAAVANGSQAAVNATLYASRWYILGFIGALGLVRACFDHLLTPVILRTFFKQAPEPDA
jgi:hypothetical protein